MGTEMPKPDDVEHAPKLEWEPPTLTLLGVVTDLVQTGAKSGPSQDPDGAANKFAGSPSGFRRPRGD